MNNHSRILKFPCKVSKCRVRSLVTSKIINNEEKVSTPVAKYPPIVDVPSNPREKNFHRKLQWFEKIRKLPTVEQKLIELNMPKYYGWGSTVLKDRVLGTTCLDFLKFVTRTEVYKNLPSHYYSDVSSSVENAVKRVEDPVREFIHLHNACGTKRSYTIERAPQWLQNNVTQSNFLVGLHNIFLKHLGSDISHLPADEIDIDPRIEAFWFVGGFEPINLIKKMRAGKPHTKPFADDPVDMRFRSSSRPALALRSNLGLGDVVPFDGIPEKPASDVQDTVPAVSELKNENEVYDYSAENFDPLKGSVYDTDRLVHDLKIFRLRRAVLVPGFWPGVENEHGHIFFHPRAVMEDRLEKLPEEYRDVYRPVFLQQHAINDGFARALSYGFYQGFTPVDDLTYPFVQQGVSSDGKNFQFSLYQFNTANLHTQNSTDNPKINYMWLSENMPLYETVEGDNVKGLNEDVLKLLCAMYLKKGVERQNPSPYLADYKYLMYHDAPEEFKEEFQYFLRNNVLSERRVRRKEQDPLPWEFIYKIKFKTRPFDPKYKYFENNTVSNPHKKRLDEYEPQYIPKIRRIDFKIKRKPVIHSELLFKHKFRTIKQRGKTFEDDPIVFGSMNVDKDTAPYYDGGPLWRRGVNKFQKSLLSKEERK